MRWMRALILDKEKALTGSRGAAMALSVVTVGAVMLVGTAVIALVNLNLTASHNAANGYAADMLAEMGLKRAAQLLKVAPLWGISAGVKTIRHSVDEADLEGTYETRVRSTGTLTSDGFPIIEIVSVGRAQDVKDVERTLSTTVSVQVPAFLRPAVSLYENYDGQGPLITQGDAYVSGTLDQTGRLCIRGNLTAHRTILNGGAPGGPPPSMPPECQGGGPHRVTGTTTTDLVQNPSAYLPRPVHPLSWYRWAERALWTELYGRAVPATAGLAWAAILENARNGAYPYGVIHVIDGDFTIPDSQPPSQGWTFSGHATVIVSGTLRIEANKITYGGSSDHLALIALGGISLSPAGNGPYSALFYTYDDNEAPSSADAGQVFTRTGGGPRIPIGNLEVTGTLAAGTVQMRTGRLEINQTLDRMKTAPAPAIPGMEVRLHTYQLGDPNDARFRHIWGIK